MVGMLHGLAGSAPALALVPAVSQGNLSLSLTYLAGILRWRYVVDVILWRRLGILTAAFATATCTAVQLAPLSYCQPVCDDWQLLASKRHLMGDLCGKKVAKQS